MEEEVDLRDYINVLLKWKKLIIWITVLAMLVAGGMSYFVLPKTYESTVTFLVSQPNIQPLRNVSGIEQLANPATFLALPSISSYSELVKSPGFLKTVVEKLGLDKKEPPITADGLSGMITVSNPKDSTLIEVKVDDTDPEEAYRIAKTIGEEFESYAVELNKVHLNTQSTVLESQMKQAVEELQQKEKSYKDYASSFSSELLTAAKQNLEQAQKSYKDYATKMIKEEISQSLSNLLSATKQYNDFLAAKDNIDVLSKKIDVKLSKLSEYQTDLANYKLQLASYQAQLMEAQKQFSSTGEFITLTKSVADSPFLTQLAADPNNPNFKELVNLQMKSTIVNPLYEKLNSEISSLQIQVKDILTKQATVKTLNEENLSALYALQQELANKKTALTNLSTALSVAQEDYNEAMAHYSDLSKLLSLNAGGLFNKNTQLRKEQLQLIALNKKVNEAQWNYDTAYSIYKDLSKIQNLNIGGLVALNPSFRDKQLQLITLNRELELAKSKYNLLKGSYNESKIVQTMNIATLKLAAGPVVPTRPIKPKKLFNIAVAGVAAFFFAILLAFFLEYWYGTKKEKVTNS